MRIRAGNYFGFYGTRCYLRNVLSHTDYLFNETVYELLSLLQKKGECPQEELLQELSEEYGLEDMEPFFREMRELLGMLAEEGILCLDEGEPKGSCRKKTLDSSQQQKKMPRKAPSEETISIPAQAGEWCAENHRLFSASLELTYRCNERCIHCYIDDETKQEYPKELSTVEWKRVLKELRDLGCMSVLLTGGEVLLRKDFLEIAAYAAKLGMLTDIYTNGYLLTEEMLLQLLSLYPNSVSFSLYGGTASVHDQVTQVPGSFERSLRMIKLAKQAGADVYIKSVFLRQNLDDMDRLYALCRELEIPLHANLTVVDSQNGVSADFCRLSGHEQLQKALALLDTEKPGEGNPPPRDPDAQICNAGKNMLSISPDGDVFPCIMMKEWLGNVKQESLHQIWQRLAVREGVCSLTMRDLCPECGQCNFLDTCSLCPGRTGTSKERRPVPSDVCEQARERLDLIGGERDE